MKTAILTVGTEILFGQIVNTNAAFLSQELQNMGFDVMYHYSDQSLQTRNLHHLVLLVVFPVVVVEAVYLDLN